MKRFSSRLLATLVVVLLVMTVLAVPALAGVGTYRYTDWQLSNDYNQISVAGKTWDNPVVIYRMRSSADGVDEVQFGWMHAGWLLSSPTNQAYTPETEFGQTDQEMHDFLDSQAKIYPETDLISIGGKPWQESAYAQYFVDKVLATTTYDKDKLKAAMLDERNNGHVKDVLGGQTVADAEAATPLSGLPMRTLAFYTYRNFADFQTDADTQFPSDKAFRKVDLGTYGTWLAAHQPTASTGSGSGNTPIKISLDIDSPQITIQKGLSVSFVSLDVSPWNPRGTTLIPVRGVFEGMDAKVDWLADTRQVHITKSTMDILLTVDSDQAVVNGKTYTMKEPAQMKGSRVLIPLRFVSETLGYTVTWKADQPKHIEITAQ